VVLTTTTFPVRAAVGRGDVGTKVDGDVGGLLCSVDDGIVIVIVVVENVELEISSVVTVVGRMLGM
jgi:hypothetical protein